MPTLCTISLALAWPMPWMYCSAITTRLLVGMLTPAIRATARSSPGHGKNAKHAPGNRAILRRGAGAATRPFAEGSPYRDEGVRVNAEGLRGAARGRFL